MELAFLAELREGRAVVRAAAGGRSPAADSRLACYAEALLRGRLPSLLQDAQADEDARRAAAASGLAVGSHLALPVRLADESLQAVLCCLRTQPEPTLNERDLRTLQLFASAAARLLQARAHARFEDDARAARVREVLRLRQFSMVYQPIFDLDRHVLVAYEALTRFHARPAQAPDRWFADAQAAGLQGPLERAAIAMALPALAQLPAPVYLSVNVSPATLLEPGFAQLFEGLPLARLMLEITEHASVEDYEPVNQVLAPLRVAGLKLAVDDAGAGFSSFRHILQLRPNVIKLDASLIRDIDRRPDSRALAAALIRFAQETRCRIVAEGVESEAELTLLRTLAVDRAQGYLLGRPGPLPAPQREHA